MGLKAWLVHHDRTDDWTREHLGHDLAKAALAAQREGLELPAALPRLLDLVHPYFMQGGFHRSPRPTWPAAFLAEAAAALTLMFDTIASAIDADR